MPGSPFTDDGAVAILSSDGSQLLYSSYLGGAKFDDCTGGAFDAAGNIYLTGATNSTDFPLTPNAFQHTLGASGPNNNDGFLVKLAAGGSPLVYSSYLGGKGTGSGESVAVDSQNRPTVVVFTNSNGFPVTASAYQKKFGGGQFDAFATRFKANLSALDYSTYLGGTLRDDALGIALSGNNTVITGNTLSSNFLVTGNAIQSTFGGGSVYGDAFVIVLNSTGSALKFSTYLGGSADDDFQSLVVKGNVIYLGSWSLSADFPVTPNAFQGTCSNGCFGGDITLSKITLP